MSRDADHRDAPDQALRIRVLLALYDRQAKEVARAAGIRPDTFSLFCSGKRRLAPEALERVEHAIFDEVAT